MNNKSDLLTPVQLAVHALSPFTFTFTKWLLKYHTHNQELRRRFDQLDLDGNGHVTTSELYLMFKALKVPVSQSTLDQLIKEADTDANGEIEFDEFIAVSALLTHTSFFVSSLSLTCCR